MIACPDRLVKPDLFVAKRGDDGRPHRGFMQKPLFETKHIKARR